jgi:hypothetical protein
MEMKKTLKIIISFAITFMLTMSFALEAEAFGGRVTVGQADGIPGQPVGVPVYLGGNDTGFTGLRIPLRYSSADLTPDSISFIGSMIHPEMVPWMSSDVDSQYFGLTVLPPFSTTVPEVTVDSGLIATFWFTVSPGAESQAIVIDSLDTIDTVYSPGGPVLILRRLEFVPASDGVSYPVTPQFNPGQVLILSTDVAEDDDAIVPFSYELNQNYPNPFNPSTKIGFSLPIAADVTLKVFNVLGQTVETIHSGMLSAGSHEVSWESDGAPSGVYFYRLASKHGVMTRKMVLLK